MQLVKNSQVIADDWLLLDDDADLPVDGDIIVSQTRWNLERSRLIDHAGRIGMQILGGDELEKIAEDIKHFELIALEFPSFVDGRNYSNAWLLRERYAFDGEIRATGEILRDQMFYLRRCGVDSFVVEDECDIQNLLLGLEDFSLVYQGAVDDRTPAYRRRCAQA